MNLLIDVAPLQTPARDRGIGRYTSNLLAGLQEVRPNWRIEVIEHARLDAIDPAAIHGLPVVKFPGLLPYSPETRAANDRYFGDWIAARKPDRVLIASVFEKLGVVPKFDGPRPPIAAVMYDLIPILFHEHYGVRHPREEWYTDRFRDTANVDLLLAISDAAAADARRLIGPTAPPTINIRGAVDPRLAPKPGEIPNPEPVLKKFGITRPFILYVGGYDYRKNLSGAVAGFAKLPETLRKSHQLVIGSFLPDHLTASTRHAAQTLGVGESVVLTGHVSDAELLMLYQSCRVLFFPSMYEGLGLPVLESLRCGAPVAVANGSSMPEFAGPGARFFDPHSPESMAAALADALREPPELRRAERIAFAESFTWKATAETTATALEQCQRAVTARPKRIAWISVNGVSHVPAGYDIEQIVLLGTRVSLEIAREFVVLSTREVATRHAARPYDLFVFHLGLSDREHELLPLLRRHRGLVVAHSANYDSGLLSNAINVVTLEEMEAAIEPTISAVETGDHRWRDAAMNSLADTRGEIPPDVFLEWATVRCQSGVTASASSSNG